MKAFPISNGAIRIELEEADDWRLISRLVVDAGDQNYDPATDVSGKMTNEEVREDWNDFVLPDLRDQFDATLARVSTIIEKEWVAHEGKNGGIIITGEDCHDWYSVLNRARLALEARHGLGNIKQIHAVDPELHAARLRDRLYCALQSLILDHSFT